MVPRSGPSPPRRGSAQTHTTTTRATRPHQIKCGPRVRRARMGLQAAQGVVSAAECSWGARHAWGCCLTGAMIAQKGFLLPRTFRRHESSVIGGVDAGAAAGGCDPASFRFLRSRLIVSFDTFRRPAASRAGMVRSVARSYAALFGWMADTRPRGALPSIATVIRPHEGLASRSRREPDGAAKRRPRRERHL